MAAFRNTWSAKFFCAMRKRSENPTWENAMIVCIWSDTYAKLITASDACTTGDSADHKVKTCAIDVWSVKVVETSQIQLIGRKTTTLAHGALVDLKHSALPQATSLSTSRSQSFSDVVLRNQYSSVDARTDIAFFCEKLRKIENTMRTIRKIQVSPLFFFKNSKAPSPVFQSMVAPLKRIQVHRRSVHLLRTENIKTTRPLTNHGSARRYRGAGRNQYGLALHSR